MGRLNADELAAILYGNMREREDVDALEIVVTLRRPDEIDALLRENERLRARIKALDEELIRKQMDKVEVVHYGQLLARARKELRKNGLPFEWIK